MARIASTSRGVRLRVSSGRVVVIAPSVSDTARRHIGDHPGPAPGNRSAVPAVAEHHDGAAAEGHGLTGGHVGPDREVRTGGHDDLARTPASLGSGDVD